MASLITSHSLVANNQRNKNETEQDDYHQKKFRHILTERQLTTLKNIEKQLLEDRPSTSSRTCPECQRNFIIITVDGTEIDCCPYCRSFWFDSSELAVICVEEKDIPETALRSRTSKYPCPVCGEIMKEHLYLRGNNLLVDRCPAHGVYLETGELKRAFDALNRKR